jgi:hypothetical protein
MKFLKIFILASILTLFTSSALADLNTPTTKAICGQVYGVELCVWPTYGAGFNDEYGLRASYKSDDKWVFLTERTHFIANMVDKESTDFYFKSFVDAINTQIEIKLKPIGSEEPESGIERIEWLTTQLSFSNNQLIYVP